MITLKSLKKSFGEKDVLKGVELVVEKGEFVALAGRSGSGKTTLLNVVGALLEPTSGIVVVGGVDLSKATERDRANFRNRKIGFVFQAFHVLPDRTALENAMLPAILAGASKKEASIKARENLELVGVLEFAEASPTTMSGGQLQRVAIARALATSPDVLLADEPTGNLDVETASEIVGLFKTLRSTKHVTILAVTHEDTLTSAADRVERIENGLIARAPR